MLKHIALLIIIVTGSVSLAAAQKFAYFREQVHVRIDLSNGSHDTRPVTAFVIPQRRLRQGYSPNKELIANRLLISGSVCMAVGIPVFIAGLSNSDNGREDFGTSFLQTVGGAVLTAAGIGLIIPGGIIKSINHHRLRETD